MHSFTPLYLQNNLQVSHSILRLISEIREFKGKQLLYAERKPEILASLKQVALIESVESSNRLEQIETTRTSLMKLIQRQESPKNRPQTELAGYRDVLQRIHQSHSAMRFNVSLVQQFHRDLLQYTPIPGGNFKISPNDIVEKDEAGKIIRVRFRTTPPYLVRMAMEELHHNFSLANTSIDPLLLIPNYIHDFLCIHPFHDGNGRMARLLTVLMLYQFGFEVPKYISIEKLIEDSKESYYESLNISDVNWHEGRHDYRPFAEYMLGVVLAAYRRLEANVEQQETGHGYKTALVLRVIEGLPLEFSIRDIETRCVSVSRDTIKNVLQSQKQQGKLEPVGKGRSAKWKKIG